VRLAMRIFFRKIYLINQHLVPNSGPLILACTHPNSFLDDTLMATISNRALHFLARGDVFKTRWSRAILSVFNVHPIYRASEFKNDLNKNEESFAFSRSILANKGVIIIHPEGICVHEKRVRNLRKGVGRIAFGAEEEGNWDLDLKVIPVSLNYTDAPKGGEDVMVLFGAPISIHDYKEAYVENSAKALLELNKEIKHSLKTHTIIIEDPKTDVTINNCLRIGRNNFKVEPFATVSRKRAQFDYEKRIADRLNMLSKRDEETYNALERNVTAYLDKLKANNLKDLNIARRCDHISSYLLRFFLYEGIFLFLGYLFNILPCKWAQRTTQQKVKLVEFKASVFFTLSLLVFGFIYTCLLTTCILLLGWWGFPVFIGLAFIAYRTPKNHQKWLHFRACRRIRTLKKSNPGEYEKIKDLREEICKIILP